MRCLAILGAMLVMSTSALADGVRQRGIDVDTFAFVVEPARIIVGETTEAVVRITARDDDGGPLDVAPPTVSASTGILSAPERLGPGSWLARYTPPKEAFPHVAIVSATIEHGEETAVGFVALALWGKGQTTVSTKPGSDVTVFVGADSFGPVSTDARGDARVPIIVPPGPEHAVAKSVDAVGNQSQKTIDLGVPGFNRLAAIALDDVVAGDGGGNARLVVFVVDKKGAPMIDAHLVSTASVGDVGTPIGMAPGMFFVLWKPGAVRAQSATITIALDGAPLSVATATARIIGGSPARADIMLPRRAITADENPELAVRLSVFDSGNNPVPFGAARVDVDYGRIEGLRGNELAREVTWIVPRERTVQTARMRIRGVDGRVLGSAELKLLPGAPATLSIAPLEAVVADGSTGAAVVVTAVDAWGNEVVPNGVELAVPDGRIVAPNVDVAGRRFRALYVPEPREEDDLVEVTASLGVIRATGGVRLRPRPRSLLLVGPAIGSSWNYADIVAVGPELSLLVRLPVLDGAVHTGLTLGVLQGVTNAADSAVVSYRTYPVLLEAGWRPLVVPEFGFHLGVAGGLVVVDASALQNDVELRSIEPAIAGAAVVGIAWRAGPGYLELDGRLGFGQVLGDALVPATPFGAGVVVGYRFGI